MDDDALRRRIDDARSHLERALAPPAPDLTARRERLRRHRRARLATAAAVLVATGVVVAVASGPERGPSVVAGPPPTPTRDVLEPGTARATSPSPLAGRSTMAAVWTGTEMVIWGGESSAGAHSDGAAYEPRRDSWRVLPDGPLSARNAPAAVWTGSEVFLWGGHGDGVDHADGAAFDPATGTWRSIAEAPMRSAGRPLAVWTGEEMIVLAGFNSRNAAAYDPGRDTWRSLPDLPAAPQAPAPSITWTGSHVVTATRGPMGPAGITTNAATVYSLDPSANTWTALPDLPPGLVSLAWTGERLLAVSGPLAAVLDPGAEEWTGVAGAPSRTVTGDGAAVWTGRALLLWDGGDDAFVVDPARRTWLTTPAGGLDGRAQPAGVWADGVFVGWGGFPDRADGVVLRPPEPSTRSSGPVTLPTAPERIPIGYPWRGPTAESWERWTETGHRRSGTVGSSPCNPSGTGAAIRSGTSAAASWNAARSSTPASMPTRAALRRRQEADGCPRSPHRRPSALSCRPVGAGSGSSGRR